MPGLRALCTRDQTGQPFLTQRVGLNLYVRVKTPGIDSELTGNSSVPREHYAVGDADYGVGAGLFIAMIKVEK